jgi:uncharacterized RDD family membrane protein YckC
VTIDKRGSNDRARLGPEVKPEDVALGAAVTAARVAVSLTRLALLPLRAVGKTPVAGSFGQSAVQELAYTGRAARVDGRAQVMSTARSALAAPELEELVEDAFAGPLPDAVVRGAFDDSVQRRIAAELDDEAVVVVIERVVDTNAFKVALERVLTSPQLRAALAQTSVTFADELAEQIRRRLRRLDNYIGRFLVTAPASYAGIASRSAAFVIDLVLAWVAFLVGAAVVALIGSLIGDFRPSWGLRGAAAAGWLVVLGAYFVFFWSLAGQTPGMRVAGLRVTHAGRTPGIARSAVRYVALLAAIFPLLLGLVPILFDRRRRGLQDFVAGTTVLVDGEGDGAVDGA